MCSGGMGLWILWMLLGIVILLALIAGAVYLGVRAAGSGSGQHETPEPGDSARAVLDRRFATGEISSEEYHERGAALRDSAAGGGAAPRSGAG